MSTPVAVMVSGSGTNLQALLDFQPRASYQVALVVSDRPGAFALQRAERHGVPTRVIGRKRFPTAEAWDDAALAALQEHQVRWVCLAGFMRLVTARFLDACSGRVLNIHPSLLPAFPGLHAQQQAVAYGAKVSGCTVHLVDPGMDTGPIVAQAACPVLPDDDASRLAARILGEEHQLYPQVLEWAVTGRLQVQGRRVIVTDPLSC